MSVYYVPAIWKDENDNISHVVAKLLDSDGTLNRGQRLSVARVIELLTVGHEFYTSKYNYNKQWQRRAKIHVVREANRSYIRSNHDKTETDNLENMIPMRSLGI